MPKRDAEKRCSGERKEKKAKGGDASDQLKAQKRLVAKQEAELAAQKQAALQALAVQAAALQASISMVASHGVRHPIQQWPNVMRRIMTLAAPMATSRRAEQQQWAASKLLVLRLVMTQMPTLVSTAAAAPQIEAARSFVRTSASGVSPSPNISEEGGDEEAV